MPTSTLWHMHGQCCNVRQVSPNSLNYASCVARLSCSAPSQGKVLLRIHHVPLKAMSRVKAHGCSHHGPYQAASSKVITGLQPLIRLI